MLKNFISYLKKLKTKNNKKTEDKTQFINISEIKPLPNKHKEEIERLERNFRKSLDRYNYD